MDPNETVFMHIIYAIMFYVIRAFLPSLPGAGAVTRITESNHRRTKEDFE